MLNNVELIGRVGKDPEIRYTNSDKKFAMFSIATNELKAKTTWHNVQAWDKTAEIAEQYVKKGDLLYVQGRIEYTESNGKYYTAIVAHTLKFLSSKADKQSQVIDKDKPIPKPPQKRQTASDLGYMASDKSDDLGDDDIPF